MLFTRTCVTIASFESTPSKETRGRFLDLSKAFDSVWDNGLLCKLDGNGICGNALRIIQGF